MRPVRVARIVQYELNALRPADFEVVADLRRRTERTVRDLIAEGVASSSFVVADTPTAARAILSLCVDVARWYTPESKPDPVELGARYADLVSAMLGIR